MFFCWEDFFCRFSNISLSESFDDTELELHIFVKNNEDGKGCYLSSAYFTKAGTTVAREVEETEEATNCKTEIVKVQPEFRNVYAKEAGKNPNANNSKSSLGITKTVTGDYADKDTSFEFNITVQELASEDVLKQVIKEASAADNPWSSITVKNGKITKLTAYVQDIKNYDKVPGVEDKTAKAVTLTADGNGRFTGTFTLKDGQYLTFVSLPAGFKYDVTEKGTGGFTPSATLFENVDLRNDKTLLGSQNPIQQRLATIKAGQGFSTTSAPISLTDDNDAIKVTSTSERGFGESLRSKKNILIGEHDNSFDVTNRGEDLPGTGLIVKNLPFIVMIGLGVLAFLGLTKKRRAND